MGISRKLVKEITRKLIKEIENGKLPWQQPWISVSPANFLTSKPYKGFNRLSLACSRPECRYWGTKAQIIKAGGKITKGSIPTKIIFVGFANGSESLFGNANAESVAFVKVYKLYNLMDVSGIHIEEVKPLKRARRVDDADKFISTYLSREKIRYMEYKGDNASYNLDLDLISIPSQKQFSSNQLYYSTVFHEMIHSTGHKKRLNRHLNLLFLGPN